MLIAQQKRHENIAEYLLYMWQVEDLIRACDLDDQRIDQQLVGRYLGIEGITQEQLQTIREWYLQLRDMMLQEGKRETGHLQINENILIDLTDLHLRLLKGNKDAIYSASFYQTLPYIVELRSKQATAANDASPRQTGELETCFTALYGLMLLHLQKKDVSPETQGALQQISKFIALLAEKHRMWKSGELNLDEEDN